MRRIRKIENGGMRIALTDERGLKIAFLIFAHRECNSPLGVSIIGEYISNKVKEPLK